MAKNETKGIKSIDLFLNNFFPVVYIKKNRQSKNNYYKYNNQGPFRLHLPPLPRRHHCLLVASPITRLCGRRTSILIGGLSIADATLNATTQNLAMLILGSILLGVGIDFGNQAGGVTIHIEKWSPAHLCNALNMMFQLATTLDIFSANMINYSTQMIHPSGWQPSLGLAAIPALLMSADNLLPETLNSLNGWGLTNRGCTILERSRDTKSVNVEFQDMIKANELDNTI